MDDLATAKPTAPLMKTRQGIVPSYNGQAMGRRDLNGMLISSGPRR